MVLRLRLSRPKAPGGSKRHHPRYNIVLTHSRKARDARPLEVLGTYNPIPELPPSASQGARKQKDIKLDVTRAKYWLGVGAQPSDTVWRLLSMIGLLEPKYLPTGAQTENALKAVRFPTHLPKQPSVKQGSTEGPITAAIKDNLTPGKSKTGAGTTSPMDPNAA
ncbi:ribosomal protein S16 [Polychaeton citri CBS 116435]|uniref:Ribosomal protein S16 n=1 Tax=Polychaeton citri CBS 116435 TaxID=1314669 RepID=A0A9P4UU15_9PEZI|nr:ribosomal protein S16 [Polychaeton citri CBS 116435]